MTYTPAVVGIVSAPNSTTSPLGIDAVFTGTWVDVSRFNSVVVSGSSDVPEATLNMQYSTDASTVDTNNTRPITTNSFTETSIVQAQYFRVVYINSDTAQSTFNLQSSLKVANVDNTAINSIVANDGRLNIDVFGRLRIAEPLTLFDSKFTCDRNLTEWDKIITGTGGIAYTREFPFITMTVGAGTGRVVRQTRRYHPYQPGKSFDILATGTLEVSGGVANTISRIGIFDDATDKAGGTSDAAQSNGYFFELDGTTLNVVERSYITGSLVETRVDQGNFNLDVLDGTGPSGVVIDVSKRQIFFISMEWLGVGQVIMGIYIGSNAIPCHVFRHANLDSPLPYTNRATLPIRYEISASSSVAPAEMKQICCTVISNGGFSPRGKVFSASSEITTVVNITSSLPPDPIIALRINNSVCARGTINPINASMVSLSSGNMYYVVYRVLAPANPFNAVSWTNVNANFSFAQFAKNNGAGTALTWAGGFPGDPSVIVITEGYISNNTDFSFQDLAERLIAVADITGVSDTLIIGMVGLGSGGEDVLASITWQEY